MKKIKFLNIITDYITINRMKFIVCFSLLVLGTVIGSLSALLLSDNSFNSLGIYMNNFTSASILQPVDRWSIFTFSIYNNIKCVLFMWVSGFWFGLIPLGVLQLSFKGYKMGFTSVFLIQLYRGRGILFSLISIIPQLVILLPTLITYSVFNINFALTLKQIRRRGQLLSERKDLMLKNVIFLVITMLVLVLSSIIDTFVIPPILKPICSYISV